MGKNIQEILAGPNKDEYFVDGKIAYLPPRGKAVIIGDTHGDSMSTEAIVKQVRFVEEMEQGNKDFYLVFLGDYADRGSNDVRNLEMVLELKARYPQNVILMMGNHEEGGGVPPYELPMSLQKRFAEDSTKVHHAYTQLFSLLPNVLVTGNGIVAVHGGVPNGEFSDLQALRNNEDLFKQIRWNDPNGAPGLEFALGRGRNLYSFGQEPFKTFLSRVGAQVMIRGHEYPPEGYELFFDNKLVTIFSSGGESGESGYKGQVKPKFMMVSLDEPISEIDPPRHIVSINYPAEKRTIPPPPA